MLNQMSIISRPLHFYMKQLQSADSDKMSQILLQSDVLCRYASLGNQPVVSELSLVTRVLEVVSTNEVLSKDDKLFIVSRIEFVMEVYLSEAVDEMRNCFRRNRKQCKLSLERIGEKTSIQYGDGNGDELLSYSGICFLSLLLSEKCLLKSTNASKVSLLSLFLFFDECHVRDFAQALVPFISLDAFLQHKNNHFNQAKLIHALSVYSVAQHPVKYNDQIRRLSRNLSNNIESIMFIRKKLFLQYDYKRYSFDRY